MGLLALLSSLVGPTLVGQIVEGYDSGSLNLAVPDDYPDHLEAASSTIQVNSDSSEIARVEVELTIAGGYNGDLYVTLSHGSGFSVLMNRVGRSDSSGISSFGYADPGLTQVQFSDSAVQGDVHQYRVTLSGSANFALGGPLTGVWAPDGRRTQPDSVLSADGRSALLSSFSGLNPNGGWTLSLTDWAGPDLTTSTLTSWRLDITAVPETRFFTLATGLALGGLCCLRRWSWVGKGAAWVRRERVSWPTGLGRG